MTEPIRNVKFLARKRVTVSASERLGARESKASLTGAEGQVGLLEFFLSLLGLGQAAGHRAEERKLHAASLLAKIDAVLMESSMRLDYEIARVGHLADAAAIPNEVAAQSLVTMRSQCGQMRAMVETNRSLLQSKGANATVIAELEKWNGTISVIPAQITLTVQQIELLIAKGVGHQAR